jgi:hypothetical protein
MESPAATRSARSGSGVLSVGFRKSFTRPRPYRTKEPSMRTTSPETSMDLIPRPGTTEALELGCTCHFITHEFNTQEREPAGMSIDPDPNCPLHGTNRDVRSTIFRALQHNCNADDRQFPRAGASRFAKIDGRHGTPDCRSPACVDDRGRSLSNSFLDE